MGPRPPSVWSVAAVRLGAREQQTALEVLLVILVDRMRALVPRLSGPIEVLANLRHNPFHLAGAAAVDGDLSSARSSFFVSLQIAQWLVGRPSLCPQRERMAAGSIYLSWYKLLNRLR